MVRSGSKKLATESKKYFRNPLGEFIYYEKIFKMDCEEDLRETWLETVDRYVAFMKENLGKKLKESEYKEIREGILRTKEAMPSMRLLQFAGGAARTPSLRLQLFLITRARIFLDIAEIMYVSMCGTGAGLSVESQNVQKLPQIKVETGKKLAAYVIADSKEGWCDALVHGMKRGLMVSTWSLIIRKFVRPARV